MLYVADPGFYIGTRDLAGADGFSVAAYSETLGDPTMMDDLKAGLKVAKVIALMVVHGSIVNAWSRERLKELSKDISEASGWVYPACKVIQHMSSYKGGHIKMSEQILVNSVKKGRGRPIHVPPAKCRQIQDDCFFTRYKGIRTWHRWLETELKTTGMLTVCNGFKRRFHARKDDHDTVKEAAAFMPQAITTYSILLALMRQWKDPENRRSDGSLIVEPLLLVHDSNVSQWRIEDTDFAKRKLREWFENPVTVGQVTFTIPASGTYGPTWKDQCYDL